MSYSDHLVLRNVWVSSSVLSLSLFGDALLYIILPVHADAFGISLAMVGFLLAINRIVRTFAYGIIVKIAAHIGLKKLCLIAATTAVASTLGLHDFRWGVLAKPFTCFVGFVLCGLADDYIIYAD